MDYDRYDATLHYIFKQTQGDAWFRPSEDGLSAGVCLRTDDGSFRVFPYENIALEPFELAVTALNPVVAVKIRSAAVHAALGEVSQDEKSVYVDANTRIQILDTMMMLPHADKEQLAAFIRDERVLIVWADSLDAIIPTCRDFEDRLIRLLWRSRPPHPSSTRAASIAGGAPSVSDHSLIQSPSSSHPISLSGHHRASGAATYPPEDLEKIATDGSSDGASPEKRYKRTWYGRKVEVIDDSRVDISDHPEERPVMLYAPIYNGLAAGLSVVFIGNGVKTLLEEWELDNNYVRFALVSTCPLLYCVSLFFCLQIFQNVSMAIGPIAQHHRNSKYYSARPPRPNKLIDSQLPHVSIQMPVYKEGLEAVLAPSIESLKKAMQTYSRQGGTSSIFVNDDGLRLLPPAERDVRIAFYATHNIGWVARPAHTFNAKSNPSGFLRAGRFKKASNMNYALDLSLRAERFLEGLLEEQERGGLQGLGADAYGQSYDGTPMPSGPGTMGYPGMYGMQYQNREGDDQSDILPFIPNAGTANGISTPLIPGTPRLNPTLSPSAAGNNSNSTNSHSSPLSIREKSYNPVPIDDLEERALHMAMEEVFHESGQMYRPWAANGRSCRLGEIILIVDSDTIVPEDCFRDAAREMAECPTVGVIQHESDVMQVAHHYFENGIAYFTRRINKCISMSCANGEVAPFVGHNAFLRWRAVQDAAFIDPADGKEKIWSESNVSEDFDMALRLQLRGFIIRWAAYSNGDFKEGVSLTCDDELNRWQKYAYGCSELMFNPIIQWWRKGPINHQIHKFLWSSAPIHYKISMMAYMFSYYGIAAAMTIAIINYVLLGWQFPIDGFYMHSFEIWLATTIVFFGSGNVGYTLLQYRLGEKSLLWALLENFMWIPFFFFFFGGLGIPLSQAVLAHLFSYNITWGATIKEVERSNFFKEVPKILKRFWFSLLVSIIIIAGMIIVSTSLVPYDWQINYTGWAVIFPLAIVSGCHILYPIVLNPWLMIFSY